jgi:hypothetical protein
VSSDDDPHAAATPARHTRRNRSTFDT